MNAPDDPKPGWWDEAVGPGKAFDTDKYFVICSNVIGGCRGSTGPASINPRTGKPYGLTFPVVTIADMVEAQRWLMDRLGIPDLADVTGGSMGGMQALQWAVSYPQRTRSAMVLASTARLSPQTIALDEVARQAIYADPNWNNGDYYDGDAAQRRAGRGPHDRPHHLPERRLDAREVRAPPAGARALRLRFRDRVRRGELLEATAATPSPAASTPTRSCTSPRPWTTSTCPTACLRWPDAFRHVPARASWWSATPPTGCIPPGSRRSWCARCCRTASTPPTSRSRATTAMMLSCWRWTAWPS